MDLDKCHECEQLLVCHLCESCAEHCITEGGPDACWEAHEAWRLGLPDPKFGLLFAGRSPEPGTVPPAPRPRWRS